MTEWSDKRAIETDANEITLDGGEPAFASDRLVACLDGGDPGSGRPVAAPRLHHADRVGRAFEDHLDAAVGQVRRPSADVVGLRLAGAPVPEPDVLDPPTHPDMAAHRLGAAFAAGAQTWHAGQK